MLHLTNGKAIIENVRGIAGPAPIVPWDDVLHEGPVPAGLGPAALRERRADFLAGAGADSFKEILKGLEERDRALEEALVDPRCDEIVLWFEHDLYDQLHLIQILDRVPIDGPPSRGRSGEAGGPRISLVQPRTYLGHQPLSDYPGLFDGRRMVTSAERIAARDAWGSFRSSDPRAILDVLPRITVLPHLGPALTRHLEQFPSLRNGLSRTEQATLDVIQSGVTRVRDVFVASQGREEAFFMGDAGFIFHIASLVRSHRPLLSVVDRKVRATGSPEPFDPYDLKTLDVDLTLTSLGRSVLVGESDRVELCAIDRWLGGVHISGTGPVWRWDGERQALRMA
jgi:hypothetical protein